jgi:hypothetical protein
MRTLPNSVGKWTHLWFFVLQDASSSFQRGRGFYSRRCWVCLHWKSGEPVLLPTNDMMRLQPLVIEELNRRSPNEHRGDRLAELLDRGIERSSFACVQNAVILLAWLSLTMALLGFVAMFIEQPVAI